MTEEEIGAMMAEEQFKKGEPPFGKNGAFLFTLEKFPNKAETFEKAEMEQENLVTME